MQVTVRANQDVEMVLIDLEQLCKAWVRSLRERRSLTGRKEQKPSDWLATTRKNTSDSDDHLNKHRQHTAGWEVYVQWYLSWKCNHRRKGGQRLCSLQEEHRSYPYAALRQHTCKGEDTATWEPETMEWKWNSAPLTPINNESLAEEAFILFVLTLVLVQCSFCAKVIQPGELKCAVLPVVNGLVLI